MQSRRAESQLRRVLVEMLEAESHALPWFRGAQVTSIVGFALGQLPVAAQEGLERTNQDQATASDFAAFKQLRFQEILDCTTRHSNHLAGFFDADCNSLHSGSSPFGAFVHFPAVAFVYLAESKNCLASKTRMSMQISAAVCSLLLPLIFSKRSACCGDLGHISRAF
jgi:hypothetical protein